MVTATAFVLGNENGITTVNTASHVPVVTAAPEFGLALYLIAAPNGKTIYGPSDTGGAFAIATRNKIVTELGFFSIGIGVTPNSKNLYVVISNTDQVEVIDASTLDLLASITVPLFPIGVTVLPNGRFAYVSSLDVAFATGSVSVIDISSNTVVASIAGAGVARSLFLIPSPDSRFVYITEFSGLNTVSVIDTSFNTVVATIPNVFGAGSLVISPNGDTLYVTGFPTDITDISCIYVINTGSRTVTTTIDNIYNLGSMAITPDGKTLWAPGVDQFGEFGFLYLISTVTDTVVDVITLGSASTVVPYAIAMAIPSGAPPTRQKPRDDNLALGAPRQRVGKGQPSSTQNSYRQGFAGTYS